MAELAGWVDVAWTAGMAGMAAMGVKAVIPIAATMQITAATVAMVAMVATVATVVPAETVVMAEMAAVLLLPSRKEPAPHPHRLSRTLADAVVIRDSGVNGVRAVRGGRRAREESVEEVPGEATFSVVKDRGSQVAGARMEKMDSRANRVLSAYQVRMVRMAG